MIEVIGWASSVVLILTIATQIARQWRDHTSAGVSTWLFVGQLAASVGFTIYSLLVRNWVFAVTNGKYMHVSSRNRSDSARSR